MAFMVSGHATDLQAANRATGTPAAEYLAVEFCLAEGANDGTPDRFGVNVLNADRGEAVYLRAALGTIKPVQLVVQAVMPPGSLTSRVREPTRRASFVLLLLLSSYEGHS